MFCVKCGKPVDESSKFCGNCGAPVNALNEKNVQMSENTGAPTHHETPKCTYCGHVGEWVVGPLFRKMDYIIGVAFLFLGFVPGLIYMGVVGLIRSNKNNREKKCAKCGAQNMFTNMY